jgi:type VI secretion system protein ImpH
MKKSFKKCLMNGDFTNTLLTSIDADFKAEVIAAEMVENGVPAERIIIAMLGAMKRTYRKDVEEIVEDISDFDHKEYFLVKTAKEGLYDMLPEGIFHSPTSHKSARTEREIIDSIKQRRVEEKNARLFFLPFETAINNLYLQMALYENMLDKSSEYNALVKLFANEWEIFQYLDVRQADVFLHILPLLHDLRDDLAAIKEILELIFWLPVDIQLCRQKPMKPLQPIVSTLNDCRLGINFTTGNAVYDWCEDELVITIGPMNGQQFNNFIPGKKAEKILSLLCDYLLPVDVDVTTKFELNVEDRFTRLADIENANSSTLGVNSYL